MINILGHLANILYALGFLIKDVFGLRIIMSFAITMEILYSFRVAEKPLWTNIIWCFIYLAVNGFQIIILLLEKRPAVMNGTEKQLYEKIFFNFRAKDFLKVINSGKSVSFSEGTVLAVESLPVESLILLVKGRCAIEMNERKIAEISDNMFIGEMGFLTGETASATVRTVTGCSCIVWERNILSSLMENSTEINVCMQSVFTADIISKLKTQNRDVLVKMCSI